MSSEETKMKRTSMKQAEIIAGLILMAFSIWSAILSTEVPFGWVRGEGPGAGFAPFWLSIIMLICSAAVTIKALLGKIPAGWKDKKYFETAAEGKFAFWHILSLIVALAITPVVSMYGAILFLVLFHMKFLGRKAHSWLNTIIVAIVIPVGIFVFFEMFMLIPLPKGMLDPFFDLIYSVIH
jgi:hypothetical protein